jgi:hypothetical protein
MAVDLNQETCAMCGVRLTDRSSVVENEGQLYCCSNCFVHSALRGAVQATARREACAQCGLTLLETATRVQRGVQVYCCNNCANARERAQVGRPA